MKPFLQELPRHYSRSPQDAELQRVLERMLARAEADKDFTLEQLFPSTASGWGLELWEEAYGLQRKPGQTEELRRLRLLTKLRGTSPSTSEQIRIIAQTFASWPAEVREFPRENRFEVWFLQAEAALDRREAMRFAINERKPAHLEWVLTESFRPILVRTEEQTKIVRLNLRVNFPSLWGAVLFNGRRRFDGAICFDQWLPGLEQSRMTVRCSVRNENRLSGRLVKQILWHLDGSGRLDGQRKLNAGTKEEYG